METLADLFLKYDTSLDGFLDSKELAFCLKDYHKKENKIARPLKRVHAEVSSVMHLHDVSGLGCLTFWEVPPSLACSLTPFGHD